MWLVSSRGETPASAARSNGVPKPWRYLPARPSRLVGSTEPNRADGSGGQRIVGESEKVGAVAGDLDVAKFQERVAEAVLKNGKVIAGSVCDGLGERERDLPAVAQADNVKAVANRGSERLGGRLPGGVNVGADLIVLIAGRPADDRWIVLGNCGGAGLSGGRCVGSGQAGRDGQSDNQASQIARTMHFTSSSQVQGLVPKIEHTVKTAHRSPPRRRDNSAASVWLAICSDRKRTPPSANKACAPAGW